MEQETILKEILNSLSEHSKQLNAKMDQGFAEVDKKFAEMNQKMDEGFTEVNKKIDNLNKKIDGNRIDLQETQETAEFAASKVLQHEKKLREINMQ